MKIPFTQKALEFSWGRDLWYGQPGCPPPWYGVALTHRLRAIHDHHGWELEFNLGPFWVSLDFYDGRHADRLPGFQGYDDPEFDVDQAAEAVSRRP